MLSSKSLSPSGAVSPGGAIGIKAPSTVKRQRSDGTSSATAVAAGAEPRTPGIFRSTSKTQMQQQSLMRTPSVGAPAPAPSTIEGRKRSASVSSHDAAIGTIATASDMVTPQTKRPKLSLSPSSTKKVLSTPKLEPSIALAIGDDFDAPVYAAVVLHAALEHMDHWPVELMQAYAEDCFGPRKWVDDEMCSLLVQNMAMAHASDAAARSSEVSAAIQDEAEEFDRYYTYLINSVPDIVEEDMGAAYNDTGSVASSSSSGSDSGEEEMLVEVAEGTIITTESNANDANNVRNGDLSSSSGDDSGEEEVLLDGSEVDAGQPINEERMALAALSHYQGATKSSQSEATEEKDEESPNQKPEAVEESGRDANDVPMEEADASSLVSSVPPTTPMSNAEDSVLERVDFPSLGDKHLNLEPVRQRYFGTVLTFAQESIADALEERLGAKVKQNSRLLSTLPSFIAVPRVRSLSASHLERWLQSPAISGLARTLFASLVQAMEDVEPPLEEDMHAIGHILAMKLKANQLSAHVDNIKAITIQIPTMSVSRHMFLQLLQQTYSDMESKPSTATEEIASISFLASVYESLPKVGLAPDALAAAFFDIIEEKLSCKEDHGEKISPPTQMVNRLVGLVRRVASALGSSYDGNMLASSLLQPHGWEAPAISANQADILARIAFELMVQMVPTSLVSSKAAAMNRKLSRIQRQQPSAVGLRTALSSEDQDVNPEELAKLESALSSAKKVAFRWCLATYAKTVGAHLDGKEIPDAENEKGRKRKRSKKEQIIGAGTPDYRSALDGDSPHDQCGGIDSASCRLLKTVRCLLLFSSPESEELHSFLRLPDGIETMDDSQRARIDICHNYGLDIDESIMRKVLDAACGPEATISKLTALTLIEHLFLGCRQGRRATAIVKNASIVWDLYELTMYTPPSNALETTQNENGSSSDDNAWDDDDGDYASFGKRRRDQSSTSENDTKKADSTLPQLALPGLWWRVTSLALVLCGSDCSGVAAELWQESPTLRAIIKMVTSGRYRFPTVDSDEVLRSEMKLGEANMREKEAQITERLFLPTPSNSDAKRRKKNDEIHFPKGSRVSARQQAKREKLLALQREREAAEALAEAQRRKQLLRAAQKSIMIFNPRGVARKPPKETVGLLLSVADSFGLSEKFRLCQEPDFLLRAIGSTSRESIERAYDWLIPIISSHPETINRLPSSASCFLLIRAYGAEGGSNKQLLELAAPLRYHVGACISGDFGESHALKAADLLFLDMSDAKSDRRLCARRVLKEATSRMRDEDELDITDEDDLSWLLSLTKVKNANGIIATAIKHMSHAVAYERGGVLRSLLLALDAFVAFSKSNATSAAGDVQFGELLCELLSLRPHVCCDSMDRYSDLRSLALSVVSRVFQKNVAAYLDDSTDVGTQCKGLVSLAIKVPSAGDTSYAIEMVSLPYYSLQASLVLVANWVGGGLELDGASLSKSSANLSDAKAACAYLAQSLIVPPLAIASDMQLPGAAGAIFTNKQRAVLVEQWVMLAKSRCEQIASLAARSAPDVFLPRLILCCGISSKSLHCMMRRLGQTALASSEPDKYFSRLLSASAISSWGSGHHIGGRRAVVRKLLGRISAYFKLDGNDSIENDEAQSMFLAWLVEYCKEEVAKQKSRQKPSKVASASDLPTILQRLPQSGSMSTLLLESKDDDSLDKETQKSLEFGRFPLFVSSELQHIPPSTEEPPLLTEEAVRKAIHDDNIEEMDRALSSLVRTLEIGSDLSLEEKVEQPINSIIREIATPTVPHSPAFVNFYLKWVPMLSQFFWDDSLNAILFENNSPSSSIGTASALDDIVVQCAKSWGEEQLQSCQIWVLNAVNESDIANHSAIRMVNFLVVSSNQSSSMRVPFAESTAPTYGAVSSQLHATTAIKLALECARLENDSTSTTPLAEGQRDSERNMLPSWMLLLQLVARCGKKHISLVANSIMSQLPSEDCRASLYPSILLRLYVLFPNLMSLGDAKLREVLIKAACDEVSVWLTWRCPLDEQMRQMIANLAVNWSQRHLQTMVDLSKRQPLIVLRHFPCIINALVEDAAVRDNTANIPMTTGLASAASSQGSALAKTKSGIVRVTVSHWGYCLTEPLWSSLLDIISALPTEVIFSCGLKMGLLDIFETYIKIIWTQHSLKCPDHTARIRTKMAALLSSFNQFNALVWAEWMESRIPDLQRLGPIRDIVAFCEIGSNA